MLETDYLIVGTGAIGMNFADVLLDETDTDILMVDRHAAPGGHWNDAYSFVRLHQPSAYYGVPSCQLGDKRIDQFGTNKGYFELPTGAEVSAYFERVMRQRLLPSGRVRYLPLHDYNENNAKVTTLLSGASQKVKVRRKIVDTTFLKTTVPSTHTPSFAVAEGVRLTTPNGLPQMASGNAKYTVIGGGKTGMDTCVWLLGNGAKANQIRWIVPRDSWLINRAITQPGDEQFYENVGGYAAILEAAVDGETVDDIFASMEASKCMLRIDKTVQPTMYRNATISQAEADALGTINDVIRMGRVRRIQPDLIELQNGKVKADPEHLYVDCTAKAFDTRESETIFTPGKIVPQILQMGSVCLSASIIAYVEANYRSDSEKNDICAPIPLMNSDKDWLKVLYWHLRNAGRWHDENSLGQWIKSNRLSGFGAPKGTAECPDPRYVEISRRIKDAAPKAHSNLKRLLKITSPH